MRNGLLILLLFSLQSIGISQSIIWERSYGSFTNLYSNIESFDTLNGGYALAISELNTTSNRPRIIVTNKIGDTLWTRRFADTIGSNFRCPVKVLNKSIYYVPNFLKNKMTDTGGVHLLKINSIGEIKRIGSYEITGRNSFVATDVNVDDNIFYISGRAINTTIPATKGGWEKIGLLKLDTLGKELLQSQYIESDTLVTITYVSSGLPYASKNFVFYGRGDLPADTRPFLLKINERWDTLAFKKYFSSDFGSNYSRWYEAFYGNMIVGQDGQFYICGSYTNNKPSSSHFFIAKVDSSLNLKWVQEPGKIANNKGISGSRIQQLPDGNLLLVGADAGIGFIALYKLDTAGNFLDSVRVSSNIGSKFQQINYMQYYPKENSLVYAGSIDNKAYLAKIDMGKMVTGTEPKVIQMQTSFSISPNPSNGFLQLHSLQFGNLEIYDVQGHLVKKLKVDNPNQLVNVQDLNSGTYLYRFSTENNVQYGKLLKE